MSNFIIKPSYKTEYSRVHDNEFLWKENNIYVMAGHRLALWCWLQCENVFEKEHVLIHIDEHTDARRWAGPGEPECLEQALTIFEDLKNFEIYESLQCPYRDPWTGRQTRPCITYDNFVHLAAKANLFKHYYIYSSVGDWHTGLSDTKYDWYQKVADVYGLADNIKKNKNKCIVDVDLDFFDCDDRAMFPEGVSEDDLLKSVCKIISEHRDMISMITISLNDRPGDQLWDKRQHQLSIVKDILQMEVSIPIIEDYYN